MNNNNKTILICGYPLHNSIKRVDMTMTWHRDLTNVQNSIHNQFDLNNFLNTNVHQYLKYIYKSWNINSPPPKKKREKKWPYFVVKKENKGSESILIKLFLFWFIGSSFSCCHNYLLNTKIYNQEKVGCYYVFF